MIEYECDFKKIYNEKESPCCNACRATPIVCQRVG